ncbi:MAG: 4Fe-4S dicluster domain-containing protein [Chloroflexi bacterium]|nr:MAG: 4Fe-4S dicluster domain-containing protein [Chloroflexota bacterium]
MNTTQPERPASSRARVVGGWWAPAVGASVFGLVTAFELDRTGATREIFFNVQQPWAVYVMLSVLTGLMVYGIGRHATLWAIGQPTPGLREQITKRLTHFVRLGLAQEKIRRDRYAGIMHWCIFSSIVVLTFVTAQVAIDDDLGLHFLKGPYYLFFSFYGDLFGVVGLVGVGMALYRRYFDDFHRIRWAERLEDHLIIWGLGVILLSGFALETLRITADELHQHPDWAPWSFASYGLALGLDMFKFEEHQLLAAHTWVWWGHLVAAMGWLGLIVFTKLDHIFFAPINAYLLRTDSPGRLTKIENIEEREVFGVGQIQDFTWKQLFELDACVRCGRCTAVCPANIAGQPLSPMHLIQDLKLHLADVGPAVQKAGHEGHDVRAVSPLAMVGEVIKDETLWACRTCGACVQECPVMIEHVPTIVDMRRYLVMDEARVPATAQAALENLEQRGHPWRGTTFTRTTWMEGLGDVPIFDGSQEYLYWVGCSGSLVERNLPVTQSVFKLLREAGTSFGVLGQEETCNGDPARRLGNEYLYQILAQQLVETFKSKNVQRVITNCPHCFNTFKNEYPQFDGNFEVLHHTEFLAQALQGGKLKAAHPVASDVTYHDSCYLGRLNGVYDAPRQILDFIPGTNVTEMKRNMSRGLCCGAGGGNMWQEEVGARRVNHVRTEEAVETGATSVISNCPFCIQMFEDGIPAVQPQEEGRMRAFDIAELLDKAVFGEPAPRS